MRCKFSFIFFLFYKTMNPPLWRIFSFYAFKIKIITCFIYSIHDLYSFIYLVYAMQFSLTKRRNNLQLNYSLVSPFHLMLITSVHVNNNLSMKFFHPLTKRDIMTDVNPNSDLLTTDSTHTSNSESTQPNKKSRFSPTVKGALIGAVAGSVLPVFGTFSGALVGGIAGKVYEKKYCPHSA